MRPVSYGVVIVSRCCNW